jgi:hypothetical protein
MSDQHFQRRKRISSSKKSSLKRKLSVYLSPSNVNIEKDSPPKTLTRFHDAEYFSMLAHAISGGIKSPLQFVLQVIFIKYHKMHKV